VQTCRRGSESDAACRMEPADADAGAGTNVGTRPDTASSSHHRGPRASRGAHGWIKFGNACGGSRARIAAGMFGIPARGTGSVKMNGYTPHDIDYIPPNYEPDAISQRALRRSIRWRHGRTAAMRVAMNYPEAMVALMNSNVAGRRKFPKRS